MQEHGAGHAKAEERQAQLLREALQREAALSHETRGAHEEVARLRQLLRAAEDRCGMGHRCWEEGGTKRVHGYSPSRHPMDC